jgi:Spy/CpxP family protein refolding chaperone
MRIRAIALFVLSAAVATAAQGQNPGPARAQEMRRQLEQRFLERMRTDLQLTAEQDAKVRSILGNFATRRRTLEDEERRLRQALSGQLRPGIAANADSVSMTVDALTANRVSYAQLIQGEMKELGGVLTPIQRGQLFLMREQLLMRAQELRQQARMRGGPGGPPPPE